jgi:hypothetical protein
MSFFKKHYEKVILSIVLLLLAVAAAALPLEVSRVRQFLDEQLNSVVETTPRPFEEIDLSTNRAVIQRLATPVDLTFGEPHNVFNPVQWQKRSDGVLIKIPTSSHKGAAALVVTKIEELKLSVSYEGVEQTADNIRYQFLISRDGAGSQDARRKQSASPAQPRNNIFTLTEVLGPKEAPVAFKLRLKDEKEDITVTKDKPYTRVVGFAADLKYPLHNQTFPRVRAKEVLPRLIQDDETYNIVAITANEVVLSAKSNDKRTTLKLNPSPPMK